MKRFTSLMLLLSLIFTLSVPIFAVEDLSNTDTTPVVADTDSVRAAISVSPTVDGTYAQSQSYEPMISGYLETVDDSMVYEIEIDHSIVPEVYLYAYCYNATGDVKIVVTNSEGTKVNTLSLVNRAIGYNLGFYPKEFHKFSNSTGATEVYTVTVTTSTGNAGYAINFGTKETFVEDFGGDNITTVAKNYCTEETKNLEIPGHFIGFTALLDTGESFRYTADGFTYISALTYHNRVLSLTVRDAETKELVYESNDDDTGLWAPTPNPLYYVTAGLNLEAGRDYIIQFKSEVPISADVDDTYLIYIGFPYVVSRSINLQSSSTYSIPANTTKTYTFNVSGYPESAMAGMTTIASFNATKSVTNACITSCVITAPNGRSYTTTYAGKYNSFLLNAMNYFGGENAPINGQWKVTIRTSKAVSGFRFKLTGTYRTILGDDGN